MKRCRLVVPILALCAVLFSSTQELHAQSGQGARKFEQLAQQLMLTPQQKAQLIPILMAEAPKIKAIKADSSLSRFQKLKQLKAVHDETDPQVRSILTSEQYQKLQQIRQREIQQAIQSRQNQ